VPILSFGYFTEKFIDAVLGSAFCFSLLSFIDPFREFWL